MRVRSTLIVLVAFSQPVQSHESWISRNMYRDPLTGQLCCNEQDCHILSSEEVRQSEGSFEIEIPHFGATKKFSIPFSRVLPSQDGEYWACLSSEAFSKGRGVTLGVRCFFAPLEM
jgi:hypothetical protein